MHLPAIFLLFGRFRGQAEPWPIFTSCHSSTTSASGREMAQPGMLDFWGLLLGGFVYEQAATLLVYLDPQGSKVFPVVSFSGPPKSPTEPLESRKVSIFRDFNTSRRTAITRQWRGPTQYRRISCRRGSSADWERTRRKGAGLASNLTCSQRYALALHVVRPVSAPTPRYGSNRGKY